MNCYSSNAGTIVVFTRYPVPGKVKTRLITSLGPDGAARLHRELTEHTVSIARSYRNVYGADLEIRFDGSDGKDMENWLGGGLRYVPQGEGDLGKRMENALIDAIAGKAGKVVIIGADIPGIEVEILRRAFLRLEGNDVVIGPATDGGYYLIGFSSRVPGVFESIEWGTERVYEQTIERIIRGAQSFGVIDVLDDIDRPEDIPLREKMKQSGRDDEGPG